MKLIPSSTGGRIRFAVLLGILLIVGIARRNQASLLYSRLPVLYNYACYTPQEGDILFQPLPHNDLADAIEGTTHSPYSHCGVVLKNDKGRWVVIEAIFNVHETPLFLWELRGRGGAFDAYRLDPKYASIIPRYKEALLTFLGRPYDYNYDMKDKRGAYCSSLCYLAFQLATGEQMGKLEKLRDLDWKPYERFVREDQDGSLPLDRVMITPASLSRAPQLHEVYHSSF